MEITYIAHSGFLVETKRAYYLFDYWTGTLPVLGESKPLYVFVSHRHEDHFSPAVFDLMSGREHICYVLSYDIKLSPFHLKKYKIPEEALPKIVTVRADEDRRFKEFSLRTIKSTDAGVAFFLDTDEGCLYHAGDLGWWVREGDGRQERNNMTARFKRSMEYLRGRRIEAAFVPLDPRLGETYYLGMEYLMQTADVKHVFPMHCWEEYEVIDRFLSEGHAGPNGGRIVRIKGHGSRFTV